MEGRIIFLMLLAWLSLPILMLVCGEEMINVDFSFTSSIWPPPEPSDTDLTSSPDVTECECTLIFNCNDENLQRDGVGLLDFKMGYSCESSLEVCCKTSKSIPTYKPIISNDETSETNCGHRNVKGVGFKLVAPTVEAQFGEFPWMIAVLIDEKEKIKTNENAHMFNFHCGGSLIHPKVVLTSAHNIYKTDIAKLSVRAGEWDFKTLLEHIPHQDRRIEKAIFHNEFNADSGHNNIALLVLEKEFVLTDNVALICLPHQDDVIINKDCVSSGWGKDSFGKEGKLQEIMKKIELPIVPRDECQNALRETRLGTNFRLHESYICAGGEGSDTCKGDGGGPLICPINCGYETIYQQVGIVAWGIGCKSTIPSAYSNVALFIDWIDNNMDELDLEKHYKL